MKTLPDPVHDGKTCPPRRIPSHARMTNDALRSAYDALADQYEKKTWFDQNILGGKRLRHKLLSKASGKILDVACGTGRNFPIFAPDSDITAVDLSPNMLEAARKIAIHHNLKVTLNVMDAERLEFADGIFDTVVSTLSTCTFPNPVQALREMRRVCRPGGSILLLEHGHSSLPWLAGYQDRNEFKHYREHAGCRWNQDPPDLIRTAGIKVLTSRRSVAGIFHSIEATP